ncbi:alpha/beta hydrolase [Rhodobacteraceae bacterium RKSG542]|uniref:alpha/beta fold hydrolase n=1 Tax=Pseudovibrio flavus TaxID=2529854 RepID=UPI0012BC4904|nr:alpha/beta hydrolase [Pseudovibrio flavus]MTI19353.1 alpha/beta hydrolase [Pseudovibrio flavus]
MPSFNNNGNEFAFLDEGDGDPIVLVHGFASNKFVNWVYPGWVDLLLKDGRRVIAIDNRGHGESHKFYSPEDYGAPVMAGDVLALLDHLDIKQADFMGYSMGTRISAFCALAQPERVRSLIFGGMGYGLISGVGNPEPIINGLLADNIRDIEDRTGRAFRAFAEQTKSDRKALAACMQSARKPISEADIAQITAPTLIAVGTKDDVAGDPQRLADLMQNAQVLDIPNRDHMVAVGDKVFKQGVLEFLSELG